jgi:hypothetical protein
MNLAGTIYMSKRATRSVWAMPRFSRPVWLRTNKGHGHGRQEEGI